MFFAGPRDRCRDVLLLAFAPFEPSAAHARAAKVEAQRRDVRGLESARRAKDDLVVQRPALGGERMTHDRDAGGILQLAIERLQPAGASIQIDMTKRLRIHDNLTSTESPSTRTACVVTAISGFPGHAPVTTSNPHNCQGQAISFPARSPSACGPPRCGRGLSVPENAFAGV